MEGPLGFIHSEMDLKVLILFILRRLPEPAAWEELTDMTLLSDGAIGYFDFSECLTDLVRTGHVEKVGDTYAVTDKGRVNGEAMESSLPYSVRVRAEKAAATLASLQRRRKMIEAGHEMRSRGASPSTSASPTGWGQSSPWTCSPATESRPPRWRKTSKRTPKSSMERSWSSY